MDPQQRASDKIEFVVGSELRLGNILKEADVAPLLRAALSAGAETARIVDDRGMVLWAEGDMPSGIDVDDFSTPELRRGGFHLRIRTLFHEGEPVGHLILVFRDPADERFLSGLTGMAFAGISTIMKNTVKRMLTTELHTTVVQQSYEDLLETNRLLRESEGRYRALAESLEKQVEERTEKLKRTQMRLFRQEKMASVGQLAAGVAHEINNPLGFISSNLNTFDRYFQRLKEMLEVYRSLAGVPASSAQTAEEQFRQKKIGFIISDIPDLLRQSRDGAERVSKIVADLKGFSHIDDREETLADLNEEIRRTISVLVNESRDKAVFETHFGRIPSFLCEPGLLCQVFFNIILNAIQAAPEKVQIVIETWSDEQSILVRIADDGPGIPAEIRERIFEPFFTTREVGSGTGLGLSVTYDIVKAYGGDIEVSSLPGNTVFTVSLPLRRTKDV